MSVRVIPNLGERVETGAVAFDADWPGLFIRGDDCLYLAGILEDLLAHRALNPMQEFTLRHYLRTIELDVRMGAPKE